MDKRTLGIIPARGGSKSIPRKNIKPFCGKPLIAWAIETLRASGVLDRVVVSTDDEEIAAAAKKFGAEVPFMRPAELAEDTTPTLPVLQHALTWLKENEGYAPHYVVLLEPTSPGKRPFHITQAVSLLKESGADAVVSISEVPGVFNPHWQFTLEENNRLRIFTGEEIKNIIRRRQELPRTYCRGSSVYGFKTELLFAAEPSFYGEDTRGYVIDARYSFDIDTPEDWDIAERMFQKILAEEKV
jgi:N-acylneuraminate cytidylyltransferase